jgi:glycosyltransferase involved in cell wall biosynthesis
LERRLSVTVVACLATWNAETFITNTLESLAAQTYPDFRILISDDASSDATAAICTDFATRDSRFRVIRQSQRIGWVANVNALLQTGQGDFFLIVPHDDLLHPTYVARLVESLKNNPKAILAYSDIELVHLDKEREFQAYTELEGVGNRMDRAERMLSQRGNWSIPYRGLFRSDAVVQIGGLRTNLAGEFVADWPWLVHLCLLGEFVRVPEVLYTRIVRKTSLSRTWNYTARKFLAATLACGREIYRSRLSLVEKLRLNISLIRAALRWSLEGFMFHINRIRRSS